MKIFRKLREAFQKISQSFFSRYEHRIHNEGRIIKSHFQWDL